MGMFIGLPRSVMPRMALLRLRYRVLAAGRDPLRKDCGYASTFTVIQRAYF